ncbi:hypothetical protein M885DRAFT_518417 [Pelagophyceae sp. CCMP2097]|nr:hypothetical protein M885DRAFT_518417 [Pelagophyceae sp. CCMP2097]
MRLLWLSACAALVLGFEPRAFEPRAFEPRCSLQNFPHDPAKTTRIAIGLFGLMRANCTANNFERFMLEGLLKHRGHAYTVDVFVHANIIAAGQITNLRTNEVGDAVPAADEILHFKPCSYTFEDQGLVDEQLRPLQKNMAVGFKDMYKDGGASALNLIRSLYSLDTVGNLIKAREALLGFKYDVVASVRLDTIFTRAVPGHVYANLGDVGVFVPHFGCSVTGVVLMNDRFALGSRAGMLEAYMPRVHDVTNFEMKRNTTHNSDLKHAAFSGERHLLHVMRAKNVVVERAQWVCMRRVRAAGKIHLKLFSSSGKCALEDSVEVCTPEVMLETPVCRVGSGCHQRGSSRSILRFDGQDWCEKERMALPSCRSKTMHLTLDHDP